MESKFPIVAVSCLLVLASLASGTAMAQNSTEENSQQPPQNNNQSNSGGSGYTQIIVDNEKNTKIAKNEMGWTQMMNQVEMQEKCTNLETLVHFDTYLESKQSSYFMFQVLWGDAMGKAYPYKVNNINLTTVTGQPVKIFQSEPQGDIAYKIVVLARDMPALGTDLLLKFTVCSDVRGLFEVGTLVIVFDYTWEKVKLSGNVPAEIYNSAKLLIMDGKATGPNNNNGGGGGLLQKVPGPGLPALVALMAIGAWVARRRLR